MNWRNHKFIIISLSIFVLLFGGAVFVLLHFQSGYESQKKTLQSKRQQLSTLNSRRPFPSQQNADILMENKAQLDAFFTNLISSLSNEQIEPEAMESAQFPTLLARTGNRIRQQAVDSNVLLPENFYFGFSRYSDGSLPPPESVERLTVQIKTIEHLLQTFYEAGVKTIISVKRDEFEGASGDGAIAMNRRENLLDRRRSVSPRRPGRANEPSETRSESDLYTKETITIVFTSGDAALWDVLNRLASDPILTAVQHVELENPARPEASTVPLYRNAEGSSVKAVRQPQAPGNEFRDIGALFPGNSAVSAREKEQNKGPLASHEERIVAGREWVEGTMIIDVYRFKNPASQTDGEESS